MLGFITVGLAMQRELKAYGQEADSDTATGPSVDTASSDGSNGDTTQIDSPSKPGVIYARVSSRKQAEEGTSLSEQVRNLRQVAEERDIDLIESAIRDDAESGTDFDREGIRRVRQLAQKERISYVLVDDVDRIGRHAAETLSYLYDLREYSGVTVITSESGELDIEVFSDLAQVMMKSLSSQIANENRARRAYNARVEKFKQKNWSVFFETTPVGYARTDDDWLIVNPAEAEIVYDIFETLVDVPVEAAYAKTADRVRVPEDDDRIQLSEEDLTSKRIKSLVQKQVYIGKPTVGDDDTDEGITVTDSRLKIISDDLFSRAQEKVNAINDHYSNNEDEPEDISDFVAEFGIREVADSSPIIQIICPDCDGELVKNGQRKLTDRTVHNYLCNSCGRQRKFPTEQELSKMEESDVDE